VKLPYILCPIHCAEASKKGFYNLIISVEQSIYHEFEIPTCYFIKIDVTID
jgi:hypothetical protein